jgi:hypothetical protein
VGNDLRIQLFHVNELQLSIHVDTGRLAVTQLVTKGGNHRIIKWLPERAEHIWDNHARETCIVFLRPCGEKRSSALLRLSIRVIPFFLRGRGEYYVWISPGFFKRLHEALHQVNIRIINNLRVRMAVHRGQVNDHVTFAGPFL